jgi:phospholipid-binding lipoprotein MlaA
MRRSVLALALLPCLAFPAQAAPDPLEAVNRRIHGFNALAQDWVLAPAAELWRAHVPERWRRRVGNAVANLGEPVTAASGLAAGEAALAGHAMIRFGINTTIGLAGARDAAAEMGWPRRVFTPGDAACAWGVPSGPFLMLPLFGPSSLRDATAGIATNALLAQGIGLAPVAGWQGADAFLLYDRLHDELRRVERQALDPYAVLRSAWTQRRAAACPADAAQQEEAAQGG